MIARRTNLFNILLRKPYIIFLLISAWVCLEYICLGMYSFIQSGDPISFHVPRMIVLWNNFRTYGLSYWFPYSVCGYDGLANNQVYWNVFNLLYAILPPWAVYQLSLFIERFIAGYFTYRLCKDFLSLDKKSSICAGIVFLFFIRIQVHLGLGTSGFPLLLWSIEKLYRSAFRRKYLWMAVLGVIYSVTSSFMWVVPFVLPLAFIWFVFLRKMYSVKFLLGFGVFSFFIIVLQVPVLWAILLNGKLSHRADWDFLNPHFGGGGILAYIISLVNYNSGKLLLYSIPLFGVLIKNKIKGFKPSLLVLLLLILLPAAWYPLAGLAKDYIGMFKGVNFIYFHVYIPFFLSITIAYVMQSLIHNNYSIVFDFNDNKKRMNLASIVLFFVLVVLFVQSVGLKIENSKDWLKKGNYVANFKSPDMIKLAGVSSDSPFRVATTYKNYKRYVDINYATAYGLETSDGYLTMHSKRYHNFWAKVIQPLTQKNSGLYHYFHDWGNRAGLFIPRDTGKEIVFGEYYNLDLLSLANTKYIISLYPLVVERLSLWSGYNVDNIKLWDQMSISEKILSKIKENFYGKRLYIYYNKSYLPRFYLAGNIRLFENPESLLDAMCIADVDEFRTTVFLEQRFWDGAEVYPAEGNIKIKRYAADEIVLDVNTDKSCILVLTNSYSLFWRCKVDGEERKIFPAYHTFSGVLIGPGIHEIVFEYQPPYAIKTIFKRLFGFK